jgi:hypothetical protein
MSSGPGEFVGNDPSDHVIDLDEAFGGDDVDEILDTSYSPVERPRGLNAFGNTAEEALRGETLDQRIAQEEPDVSWEDEQGLDEQADAGGSAGDARSGRLVAPDEGLGSDENKDLVGYDVGIDAGAASAEEAAVHVISDEEALAQDFDQEAESMVAQWRDDS